MNKNAIRTCLRFNSFSIVTKENHRKEKLLFHLGQKRKNKSMETEIITKEVERSSKTIMILSEGRDQVISISEIWDNWCMKLQTQEHLYFKKTVKWSWLFQAHYADISNVRFCSGVNATLTWKNGWASVQPQCMRCPEAFSMPASANGVRKWKKQKEIERCISNLDWTSLFV